MKANDIATLRDKIICVLPATRLAAKQIMGVAKDNGRLLDYTDGGERVSVICLKNNYVAVSSMQPESIVRKDKH